jgi:hypothetical protein
VAKKKKNIKKAPKVPLKKDGTPDLRYKKPAKKVVVKRKESNYNKLLKQFTKINNQLPEERKLSLKQRRDIIKNNLLPKYDEIPSYKQRIKGIKSDIFNQIDKVPPKEICDLNYIDDSEFAEVEWFSLDETISELVPDCVYVKVSAGDYGETKIFNTRNYEYGAKGVRNIVENIRPDANDNSGRYVFSGYKKLRPKKNNDGTPENYYLDFVLFIIDKRGNANPVAVAESVEFNLPKSKETRTKRGKVKKIIEEKIKSLKSKKDSRRRAKKTLEKNIKKLKEITTKTVKRPTVTNQFSKTKQFNKAADLLEKYYSEGKLTKIQYDTQLEKILKEFTK